MKSSHSSYLASPYSHLIYVLIASSKLPHRFLKAPLLMGTRDANSFLEQLQDRCTHPAIHPKSLAGIQAKMLQNSERSN